MNKKLYASICYLLFTSSMILILNVKNCIAIKADISQLEVTDDTWAVSLLHGKNIVRNAIIFEGKETDKHQAWAWGIAFKPIIETQGSELISYWKGVKACKEKMQSDYFSIVKSWNISSIRGQQAYEIVNNDKYDNIIKDCVSAGKTLDLLNFIENDEDYYVSNNPSYAKRILKKCGIVDNYEELFPINQRLAQLKNNLYSITQEISDIYIEFGSSSSISDAMNSLYLLDLPHLNEILQKQQVIEKIRSVILKEQKKELRLKDKGNKLESERKKAELEEKKAEIEVKKMEFELNNQKRRQEDKMILREQLKEINLIKESIEIQHKMKMNKKIEKKATLQNELLKINIKEETPKEECNIS